MNNNHQALRAKGLHKQYGNRWVVSDVDIELKKGEIIGLLGPNGAGKTTTFYMITGMIKPTKGKIFLDNNEIMIEKKDFNILDACPDYSKTLKLVEAHGDPIIYSPSDTCRGPEYYLSDFENCFWDFPNKNCKGEH